MENKVLLVDGNSLLYRAYFALPPLSANGQPVNAIHGFFTMLLRAINDNKPSSIYVMFDESSPTFRHSDYEQYKAGRSPTPDDLASQFGLLRSLLQAMGIPAISQAGWEADDLLGSAASIADKQNIPAIILTGDRDALQLASHNTSILITKKGISESLLLNPQGVKDNYGVYPEQITDLKGLMGDSSDNIPGVPGVGEKTALKLINEYQSLENTLENAHLIKGKLGEKLSDNKNIALFSKKLATIITNANLDINLNDKNILGITKGLSELAKYRLNRVIQLINALFENGGAYAKLGVQSPTYIPDENIEIKKAQSNAWGLINTALCKNVVRLSQANLKQECSLSNNEHLKGFINQINKSSTVAICLSEDLNDISMFTDNGNLARLEIKQDLISQGMYTDEVLGIIAQNIGDIQLILHGNKEFLGLLNKHGFNTETNCVWDTKIAAYIIYSSNNQVSLKQLLGNDDINAYALYNLAASQFKIMQEADLIKLAVNMEFPLSKLLFEMETTGFLVDRQMLSELSAQFTKIIDDCVKQVYELCGFSDFNLNSPKQLAEVLFERLKLPHGKKTKSGYSTDAQTLENLLDMHPSIEKILEYRKYTKLNSTYIDSLLKLTSNSPRVHTSFDQTGTVTGRISSLEPNLQNIPIRSTQGAEIRKVFIAGEGNVLLDADYSQIELRVLAHLSQDKAMMDAFNNALDIHTATAAEIFDIPIESVNATMRSNAKAVNFGLVYGISSFGLARNTNISLRQAEQFINKYFERYTGVRSFMDSCVEKGEQDGLIYTMFNRRRELAELKSKNANIRNFGKRIAMNTPVQGTAADIIKLAMLGIDMELKKHCKQAKLILQVHDELIIECPSENATQIASLLKSTMENVVKLSVPLVADVNIGKSWYEAK